MRLPPRIHHSLPHHGGTLLGHFHHPGHHLRQPFPSYGYAYGQAYGGYSAYYPYYGYSYDPSFSDYGTALNAAAEPVPTAEEKAVGTLLSASGILTNEGRPVWPLALRVLPGQEGQALRGQIDALVQLAATQAAQGRPNTAVVEKLGQATDHLRKLLLRHREERGVLAQHSYEEAERFLDKLKGAQKLLR